MTNEKYIGEYLKEVKDICDKINISQIDQAITILFEAWKNGNKVITVGNGGSSATASHFTGDLLKTIANNSSQADIRDVKGIKSICLTDNQTALTAWTNDSGWDLTYNGLLNTLYEKGDVLLLISVHGGSRWSGNLVKAMQFVKDQGGKLIALAGFDGGKMKEMCDVCIVVPKDSTPLVEGFHGEVQHIIINRLCQLVEQHNIKSQKA